MRLIGSDRSKFRVYAEFDRDVLSIGAYAIREPAMYLWEQRVEAYLMLGPVILSAVYGGRKKENLS